MSHEKNLRSHRHLLDALDKEVEAQRISNDSRSASMTTRSSILVAAAGVVGGLQIAASHSRTWFELAAASAALAAIVGVVGMWPRTGPENDVGDLEAELWPMSKNMSAYTLMHRKLEILKLDEAALRRRRYWVVAGFTLLALSISLVSLQLLGFPFL